ncbi:DUF5997 family protein [Paramicrobacterium sp. CJ85]|uniref:DUF5997 family protein n=1 Tax=Paramicrobacterium sp. CJ85 TaxID=3445355 RepID=UPI003F5EECDB
MSAPKTQSMKPATAAKKLGILLSAAPQEFRDGMVTRDQLNELQANPPEWLAELRRNGPHPRQEVARKLGVSASGLARAGITDPLTTAEIKQLLSDMPEWLVAERATQAAVREENARLKKAAKDAAERNQDH